MGIENVLHEGMVQTVLRSAPLDQIPSRETPYYTYIKLLGNTAKLCLEHLRPLIRESEEVMICAGVELEVNGQWQSAIVVGLKDRTVISWTSGIFFHNGGAFELRHGDITEIVERRVERYTGRISEKVVLSVIRKEPFQLRVPRFEGGGDLPLLVKSVLAGTLKTP